MSRRMSEMDMDEIIEVVKEKFPKSAIDIFESLELLKETISDTMDEMNEKMNKYYQERDFTSRNEIDEIMMATHKYEEVIENIMLKLEHEEIIESEDEAVKNEGNINYEDYNVDHNIKYNLYEDLKHKRPYGFRMGDDEIIRISTWQDMFVKTCEILMEYDEKRFMDFEFIDKMNGKKKKYYSTSKNGMTIPLLINGKLYVEGNGSSNAHRNRVLKMLNEFDYNVDKYKIFLRADYSEIHR